LQLNETKIEKKRARARKRSLYKRKKYINIFIFFYYVCCYLNNERKSEIKIAVIQQQNLHKSKINQE